MYTTPVLFLHCFSRIIILVYTQPKLWQDVVVVGQFWRLFLLDNRDLENRTAVEQRRMR